MRGKFRGNRRTRREIARNLVGGSIMNKIDAWRLALEIVDIDLPGIKDDRSAGLEPGADQVLHDFLLAVHHDCSAPREFMHVDAMASPLEAKLDAVMDQAFSPHAIAHARLIQQVHRSLLKNSGAASAPRRAFGSASQ